MISPENHRVSTEIHNMMAFRRDLTDYCNLLSSLGNKDKVAELSELRSIPLETLEECGIFYIGNMAEMMIPKYIGQLKDFGIISPTNMKPIYSERWVIPIKDETGLVQGMVGYSNKSDERYIYATSKYYMRGDTLWGLERLERAYELGYAILVEGITDAIHLRSIGYEPVFASCGTRPSELNMRQLNRPRYGLLRIPDRDSAGDKTKNHWITNRYITLVTPAKYKDSDELLRDSEYDNVEWMRGYVDASIEWLEEREHCGRVCSTYSATMI